MAMTPTGSLHILNQYCSSAVTRVCMLLFTWMISRSLLTPSVLARKLKLSCSVFWFILDYILIFPSMNSISQFSSFGLCWNSVDMSAFLPLDKCIEAQQLAHAFLQRQPVSVCQIMAFLDKTTFCAIAIHNYASCAMLFRVTC